MRRSPNTAPRSARTPPLLHTIVQPPCPEGPTAAACLPGTPAGIDRRRCVPQGHDRLDHREHDLLRTRPRRRHLTRRSPTPPPPNCPPGLGSGDARHPAAGRRPAALAIRQGRRRAGDGVRPRLHQSRASKSSCTDAPIHVPRQRTETPLHASRTAHRKATLWLAAIVGVLALTLASPASSQAEESNPNNYNCLGSTSAGQPEAGSEEQQVAVHVLLQRSDHRLSGSVADTRDRGLQSAGSDQPRKEAPAATRSSAPVKSPAGRPTASARPRPATRRSPGSSRSARSSAPSHASTRC